MQETYEPNTQADGVDIVTRQTVTREQLVQQQNTLFADMQRLQDSLSRLQLLIDNLPEAE